VVQNKKEIQTNQTNECSLIYVNKNIAGVTIMVLYFYFR